MKEVACGSVMGAQTCIYSRDLYYRYLLRRTWDDTLPTMQAIGINPPDADKVSLDPTLNRLTERAIAMKCGSLVLLNLFAIRSTQPRLITKASNPVGPHNEYFFREHLDRRREILVMWGAYGTHQRRGLTVAHRLHKRGMKLKCLGIGIHWQPYHILYLPPDQPSFPYIFH